jgi:hypothetical protein
VNRLCLGRAIVVGPHRILSIEDRQVTRHGGVGNAWFFAESRLHALVLCNGSDIHCLDRDGRPLHLSVLLARLPALAAELRL